MSVHPRKSVCYKADTNSWVGSRIYHRGGTSDLLTNHYHANILINLIMIELGVGGECNPDMKYVSQ